MVLSFGCNLSYVKLSTNTEFIGNLAFASNSNLNSIFIPPRCRWIGEFAFTYCTELSIFHVSRTTEMECFVLAHCPVLKSTPFQHSSLKILYNDEEEQKSNWIKNINSDEKYGLHRACSCYQPLMEVILSILETNGIGAFKLKNEAGITPSQYLRENPYADIKEIYIVREFVKKNIA